MEQTSGNSGRQRTKRAKGEQGTRKGGERATSSNDSMLLPPPPLQGTAHAAACVECACEEPATQALPLLVREEQVRKQPRDCVRKKGGGKMQFNSLPVELPPDLQAPINFPAFHTVRELPQARAASGMVYRMKAPQTG
eukprot:2866411-Rhodomonas_salina.2